MVQLTFSGKYRRSRKDTKAFVKLILKNKYNDDDENGYENALLILNLETLQRRREDLA